MQLADKRIVVLGGTSGIGLATAQLAAKRGAQVVVASSRDSSVSAALAALPSTAAGRTLDLRDEAAIAAFFEEIGSFDHLVYTAGETLQLGPLHGTDLSAARTFFETRYWGAVAAAKHAAQHLGPEGSIVLTSGIAGARPHPGWALGASICSAMEGLCRALAVDLAPVRVNIVSPGFVRTPLWRNMTAAEQETMFAEAGKALPVGRVGEPEELAEAYLFLLEQGFATGQRLVVDGGAVLV